jgi:hypothetical protein
VWVRADVVSEEEANRAGDEVDRIAKLRGLEGSRKRTVLPEGPLVLGSYGAHAGWLRIVVYWYPETSELRILMNDYQHRTETPHTKELREGIEAALRRTLPRRDVKVETETVNAIPP